MTPLPPTRIPPWLHAHRRQATWFAAAAPVLALLAWLVPIANPTDTDPNADRPLTEAPQNPPPEDLTAFLDVNRWGLSLREVNAASRMKRRNAWAADRA